MNGTKALIGGTLLSTLAAGCAQKTVYTPADVAPSQFVLGLTPEQGASASAPISVQDPAPQTYSAPPIVYEEAIEPQPVYSVIETSDTIMSMPIESDIGFVEETSFATDVTSPEVTYSEPAASEITNIDEAASAPMVEPIDVPEPVYVIENEVPPPASPELMIESELAVLDAPVLDSNIVSVLGNEVAPPTVIESAPLSAPGTAPYGQAF